ncbi:hypothetical protein HYY74_01560 [Candidatus Woesearchaeota archaeon]|nr:hypothetical protein [Candidatus Woesearchaeota archaeon]
MAGKRTGIRKWALAVAIAIVLNLFVNYGIATFYKEPKYEDYCREQGRPYPEKPVNAYPDSHDSCRGFNVPEYAYKNCADLKGVIQYRYNESGCPYEYRCETCHNDWQKAHDEYNGDVFLILVVIGVAAVAAGVLVGVESVGAGFLLGGVLSILVATIRNWSNLTDVLRFIILGLILALLVVIGYRKVRD